MSLQYLSDGESKLGRPMILPIREQLRTAQNIMALDLYNRQGDMGIRHVTYGLVTCDIGAKNVVTWDIFIS